jgi:putative hydrolase of HD superfamily
MLGRWGFEVLSHGTTMRDELKEILGLKNVMRAGWVRAGIDSPESVAAHSWGMSMLALKLTPPHLDLARVLSLCIVHDIPEVRVGDLTPHDDTSTKAADEHNAMKALAPQWVALFEEYEQGETPESRFVKQLDKLDMALQAELYQEQFNLPLEEFIESARKRVSDPELIHLLS